MKKGLEFLAAMLAGLLLAASAWAAPYSGLHVFGDSLSDAGDGPGAILSLYRFAGGCDALHPCPPYVGGHYTDGPTAAEQLAGHLLPGGATPPGFLSFAVAGATTGIGNFADGGSATAIGASGLPGMAQQVGLYASTFGAASPDTLYFLWGGANDFLTGGSPLAAAQNVAGLVSALAGLGARHFLVPNLPDLGLTPFAAGAQLIALARDFSLAFNDELARLIAALDAMPAVDIALFDTFGLFNAMLADPAAHGFANASAPCLQGQAVCADPGAHVFWDDFHPTTTAHAYIADAFARQVPEPASLLLVALGVVALSGRRARLAACRRGPGKPLPAGGHIRPIALPMRNPHETPAPI